MVALKTNGAQLLAIVCIVLLSAVLGFSLGQYPVQATNTTLTSQPQQVAQQQHSAYHTAEHRPLHIHVGKLVDIEITQQVMIDDQWVVSDKQASHLYTSGYPYEYNNIIIYGHNTGGVFGPLHQVGLDEHIVLRLANGHTRTYQVKEIAVVQPSDVSYLEPTTTEVLTLYTCTGFLDSKRLVLRAIPTSTNLVPSVVE